MVQTLVQTTLDFIKKKQVILEIITTSQSYNHTTKSNCHRHKSACFIFT